MRVVALVKLLQVTANLIAAASVLLGIWVLTTGVRGWDWVAVVSSMVTAFAIGTMFLMQRRATRWDQMLGRWDEQAYVTGSLTEALERGMTPEQWIEGYFERVMADLEGSR